MRNFGESLIYTFINVIGSFITLVFTLGVGLIIDNQVLTKEKFFGKGEVIIICVPLCISVIYSLFYNKKDSGSWSFSSILFWITLLLVMFCTWFYSMFTFENLSYTENLYTFSLFLFIYTGIAVFISKLLDSPSVNIQKNREKNLEDLEEKVNRLKK